MCWRNFYVFSLRAKICEKKVKITFFSIGCHFEIWFPEKKTITFFWQISSKLHKKLQFCIMTIRPVYHIMTEHAFWVESIVMYHRINRPFLTCLMHDFMTQNVEERSSIYLLLFYTDIVKYLWQILILFSIQFAYLTYSSSSFSDEVTIMIRHCVIHPN